MFLIPQCKIFNRLTLWVLDGGNHGNPTINGGEPQRQSGRKRRHTRIMASADMGGGKKSMRGCRNEMERGAADPPTTHTHTPCNIS